MPFQAFKRRRFQAFQRRRYRRRSSHLASLQSKMSFGVTSSQNAVKAPFWRHPLSATSFGRVAPANAVLALRMIRLQGTLGLLGCSIYIYIYNVLKALLQASLQAFKTSFKGHPMPVKSIVPNALQAPYQALFKRY